MFFSPTPSKFDQAKQAARDAASAVSGATKSAAGTVGESAHSFLEHAPKIAGNVGEAMVAKASDVGGAVAAKASGVSSAVAAKASIVGGAVAAKASDVGESLSNARDVVAAKVDAVRNRGASEADTVQAAQLRAEATRKAADVVAVEAERATREAQKKAESELARVRRELAQQRADFQRDQLEIRQRAAKMDEARVFAIEKANEIQARRTMPVEVEVPAPAKIEAPAKVEVAAKVEAPTYLEIPVPAHGPGTVEIRGADADFEYRVVGEKPGGSKLWLVIGAGVFVGAALVYFFTSRNGRRSRAAIKDRLTAVKDQAVDKVTGASDAASTTESGPIDTLAQAENPTIIEGHSHSLGTLGAVVTYDSITLSPTELLSDEVPNASSGAAEGVAVEANEPPNVADAEVELDEPHHPNIFDKVAGVVGNVAGVAEHLAGEDKDGAKQKAEEIEAAAEAAKHESKEEREVSNKKKKNK